MRTYFFIIGLLCSTVVVLGGGFLFAPLLVVPVYFGALLIIYIATVTIMYRTIYFSFTKE